jgi:acyl CoA:acetate/3-ketoacid CoA transferase alpha subunit
MPGVPAIPWPMIDMTATLGSVTIRSIAPRASSGAKRSSSAATNACASSLGTTSETVCSDDACEIMATLTEAASLASKIRRATPGIPAMPRPSTVTIAWP